MDWIGGYAQGTPAFSKQIVGGLLSTMCFLALPAATQAQNYPIGPIRIVVPYPAGGAGDLDARLIAEKMGLATPDLKIEVNGIGFIGAAG